MCCLRWLSSGDISYSLRVTRKLSVLDLGSRPCQGNIIVCVDARVVQIIFLVFATGSFFGHLAANRSY
ncbi:hypothetical protein AB1N83_011659 [Pleurotus pulmonarius]